MIPSTRYKYIEKVIYSYPTNKELLDGYEQELEYLEGHGDLKVQSYNESTNGGDVPDRVLDYVHRKQVIERRIERLNMEIGAVEEVLHQIDMEDDEHAIKLYAVLQGIYFGSGVVMITLLGIEEHEVKGLRHELVNRVNRKLKVYERKKLRDTAK